MKTDPCIYEHKGQRSNLQIWVSKVELLHALFPRVQ